MAVDSVGPSGCIDASCIDKDDSTSAPAAAAPSAPPEEAAPAAAEPPAAEPAAATEEEAPPAPASAPAAEANVDTHSDAHIESAMAVDDSGGCIDTSFIDKDDSTSAPAATAAAAAAPVSPLAAEANLVDTHSDAHIESVMVVDSVGPSGCTDASTIVSSAGTKECCEKQIGNGMAEAAAEVNLAADQLEYIHGTLKDYQLEGVQWLIRMHDNGMPMILGDETGLGKTVQIICFLAFLKYQRPVSEPNLVVVPLSLLPAWSAELEKWCSTLRVIVLAGPQSTSVDEYAQLKNNLASGVTNADVVLTSFELVTSPHLFRKSGLDSTWRYVVVDEAHRIDTSPEVARACRAIHSQSRILISGSIGQGDVQDLPALLAFQLPRLFDGAVNPAMNVADPFKDRAHKILDVLMLRRRREVTLLELPPKKEHTVRVDLSPEQMFWYKR